MPTPSLRPIFRRLAAPTVGPVVRPLAAVTVALLGAMTVGAPSWAAEADKPAAPARAALTVTAVSPKPAQLQDSVVANGSVAAWQEAIVGAEVGGLRVAELHVAVGDTVQKGQLLVSFAADSVQADVALARAALAEAKAVAAEARNNAERARAVTNTGALSEQQIGQMISAEATTQARVAVVQAQLDAQLIRMKNTQLHAPDSGVISSRTAMLGTVVGAGSELFRLIRQNRLEWRAEVTAQELLKIAVGQPVTVTNGAGVQTKGRVRTVAPTVDAQSRNGLVYVDLPNAAAGTKGFKPGMFAKGTFGLGSTTALTVPSTAVVVRDGFSYVYRLGDGNKVQQLKVQTGRVSGNQVEILEGVQATDRLVASGGSFLSDGDLVKVVAGAEAK